MLNTLTRSVAWLAFSVAVVHADVTVLLEEPYGTFGAMNPTGHAAVYFSRICADNPTTLRRCRPGETGVVISRYHRVGGYDWIAVPLVAYLYAVPEPSQIPASADADLVASLRDQYRRAHLESVAPDDPDGSTPKGDWTQLVGESYDRTMYGFRMETTAEQDDALIAKLNSSRNKTCFHLLYRNCADFVRNVVDFYYPHAVRRSFGADLGIMTPRQAAERVMKYSRKHPALDLSISEIPQVPGSLPRSTKVRGVLEFLSHSKRYAVPLAVLSILHPPLGGGLAYAWVEGSHFDPKRAAQADQMQLLQEDVAVVKQTSGTAAEAPPASSR